MRASSCTSSPASTGMRRRGARRSTPTTPTRGSPPRSGTPSRRSGSPAAGCSSPGAVPESSSASPRQARSWSASSSTPPPPRSPGRCTPTPTSAPSRSRAHAPAGRLLRPGDRERAVRRRPPARPAPQPGCPQPAQPLHPQIPAADPPRRAGRGPHLALHARRRQPRRPPRDERPGGPRRRSQAADRRAPPHGRHRRADGPPDPPPPPPRPASARHRPGRPRGWSTSTAARCGSTATWPSTRSWCSARWRSGRGCTAQTRCTSARTAPSTTRPRSSPTRSASSSTARASSGLLAGPRDTSHPPAAAGNPSRTPHLAPEGAWDGHIAALQDGTFTVTSGGLVEPLEGPRLAPRRAARAARAARHRPRAARRRGLDARGHRPRSPSSAPG